MEIDTTIPAEATGERDIRGCDFRGKDLRGECFRKARAGLKPRIIGLLLGACLCAMALGGLVAGYVGALPGLAGELLRSGPVLQVAALLVGEGLMLGLFLITLWCLGPGRALALEIIALALLTAVLAYSGDGDTIAPAAVLLSVVNGFALAALLLGVQALVLVHHLAGRRWWPLATGVASLAAVPGITEGLRGSRPTTSLDLLLGGTLLAVLLILPFAIAHRATRGDRRDQPFRWLSVVITAAFGTRFQGAVLDGADFSGAFLSHADFRGSSLSHSRWRDVQGLTFSRLEGTPLADPEVRQLLLSGDGRERIYDRKDLRDLDLEGASLERASLIDADLSGTLLRQANLYQARLVRTRLYGTDLSGADLSKACIEDWAIATDTRFDDVHCSEVYLRLNADGDQDLWRKPDLRDEYFQPGDFQDFIAPIVRTLDLYHHRDVDPRHVGHRLRTLDLFHYDTINPTAAVLAMQELAQRHPETSMDLVSLEGKGDRKVHLQAVVTGETSSDALSRQYQELYRQAAALSDQQLQAMKAQVGEENRKLYEKMCEIESLLATARQSQTNYYIHAGGDISGIVNFGQIEGGISTKVTGHD